MTKDEAVKFITAHYPNENVQWVDKGMMNHVAIVGGKFVYKFPKTPDNFKLLQKEFAVYEILKGVTTIAIPQVIELNLEKQYLCLNYVAGHIISPQQASKLTLLQQTNLANKLTLFIKEINSAEVRQKFDEVAETETSELFYIERWLKKAAEYCQANPNEYSVKYLELYDKLYQDLPYGFCGGEFLAHKDLHEDNMMFDDDMNLVGIIDFAEMRYVSIYSELRTVARFGADVVEQILQNICDAGQGVTTRQVLLFAQVYEMCILIDDKFVKKDLPWRIELANYYLKKWDLVI